MPITVVSRADASSATDTLSRYLSAVSPEWKSRVGFGTTLKWPTGIRAKGNEGVAGLTGETDGAIGYVDFRYAGRTSVPRGLIQNLEGRFVGASATSISAAFLESGRLEALPDTSVTSKNPGAYPMASIRWIVFTSQRDDPKKALFLLDLCRFLMTNNGPSERENGLVPLPQQLLEASNEWLNRAAGRVLQHAGK